MSFLDDITTTFRDASPLPRTRPGGLGEQSPHPALGAE
jgi:hypothetical protein